VTPILGAVIADQYLGKYNTILVFAAVYWVGLLVLWTTALPASIAGGHALGGYIAAIIIIGFGTGGIKSNIAPLIADQYQRRTMAIKIQKGGERTIIDPAITYQRIYVSCPLQCLWKPLLTSSLRWCSTGVLTWDLCP
jgi:POT family proton-dependent oligopeptide transporter